MGRLRIKPVVPFQDVVDIRPSFQILEDGGDWHPRAFQNPRSAHLAGNAFHSRTLRPIETRHSRSGVHGGAVGF